MNAGDKVLLVIAAIAVLIWSAGIGAKIAASNRTDEIRDVCASKKEYVLETYAENTKLVIQCQVVLK